MRRIVSAWTPNLMGAHQFVRRHALEMFFVQFMRADPQPGYQSGGYWVVLNIDEAVWRAVKAVDTNLWVVE